MNKLLVSALTLPAIGFLYGSLAAAEGGGPSLPVVLLIILLLVLLNGLFVAAEFAIIGVRPSRIGQLKDEGHKRADSVLAVLDSNQKQDHYIATAQVGITIASLGLGMYGEPQVARFIEPLLEPLLGGAAGDGLVHGVAFVISLGFVTYLHVVIGEMVPKSLALTTSDKMALTLSRPMSLAQLALSPAVRALNAVGNGLLALFRVPPAQGQQRLHSPEELELIVSESAEGGLLNEEEEEMILNIFDFSERQVGQVMTPRRKVQAIGVAMPEGKLLSFVAQSSHSRFPVFEDDLDHVVGILHLKDLLHQRLRTDEPLDVHSILRPAPIVPEYQPVEKLLAAFKRERIHMAIVVDEFGGMAGIVTLEDLIEEVVGEVRDEFDVEKEPLTRVGPGELEVAGHYLLDDLTDLVYLADETDLPDVETIGGLVVSGLGRPPERGDVLHYDGGEVRLTVLDVDGLAVARVKLEYPVAEKEEDGASSSQEADA